MESWLAMADGFVKAALDRSGG